jgi:hypothetical protein
VGQETLPLCDRADVTQQSNRTERPKERTRCQPKQSARSRTRLAAARRTETGGAPGRHEAELDAIVGTGIYIRPASVAQLVGGRTLVLVVWICAGLLSLAGALTYAQLAALIPRSGGEYAYLRTTLGELPAFLFGWMRLTVSVGTCAAMAVAVTWALTRCRCSGESQPGGLQPAVNAECAAVFAEERK